MYNISLCFFSTEQTNAIKNICRDLLYIQFLEFKTQSDFDNFLYNTEIDLFILNIENDISIVQSAYKQIQSIPKFKFTQTILSSYKKELLTSIFLEYMLPNYFLFPLNTAQQISFIELLKHNYAIKKQLNLNKYVHCQFNSNKTVYNILLDEILSIESFERKAIVHTIFEDIFIDDPLCKIKENLPENFFIQTHRSFLVNPNNIFSISKTNDTWVVNFYQSKALALVSRSHKKELNSHFNKSNLN